MNTAWPRALRLLVVPALALASCAVGTQGASGSDPTGDAGEGGAAPEGGATDSSRASDTSSGDGALASDARLDTRPSGCAASGTTGALVTFDFNAQPGDQATTPATTVVPGVTSSVLSRAAGLTASAASASMSSSEWPTAASADPNLYYALTVTPAAGCTLTLTSLALNVRASGTGPATGDVATSVNGFSPHSASFNGTSTPTVTFTGVTSSSGIEIRIYGYGAASTGGTFRIQNPLTLSGTIS